MIQLLPISSFNVLTHLKPIEIQRELLIATGHNISNELNIFSMEIGSEFKGKVGEKEFEIKRVSGIKNYFRPTVNGKVQEIDTGSRLCIIITVDVFMGSIWLIWMALASSGAIAATIYAAINLSINEFIFMAWIFPIIGFILLHAGFRSEVKKARRFILETLNARSEP